MGKLSVEVVSAKNLKREDGVLGKNDPYVQLKIGHLLSAQKHRTATKKDAGATADFNEKFEFTAGPNDDLKVFLFDDDHVHDDDIGSAKIPLKGVFETGQLQQWVTIGEGSKNHGEILLNLRALP